MLDLNNSCATLTEYNVVQKIKYSKHNSQYIHSQHSTTDKEHNTTQNICGAECTNSIAKHYLQLTWHNVLAVVQIKMHGLEHITHEDTATWIQNTEVMMVAMNCS